MKGITLAIALFGAFLGILNTWHEYDQDKIKIRVIPRIAFEMGLAAEKGACPCIDVINLSSFALTVSQVGFELKTKDILIQLSPIIPSGGKLPIRLEPHYSLSVIYSPESYKVADFKNVTCAFAKTDSGIIVKGNSPALKSLIESARENNC